VNALRTRLSLPAPRAGDLRAQALTERSVSGRVRAMITVVGGIVLVVLLLFAAYRLGYLGNKDQRFR